MSPPPFFINLALFHTFIRAPWLSSMKVDRSFRGIEWESISTMQATRLFSDLLQDRRNGSSKVEPAIFSGLAYRLPCQPSCCSYRADERMKRTHFCFCRLSMCRFINWHKGDKAFMIKEIKATV